jgi:hypothetical protein
MCNLNLKSAARKPASKTGSHVASCGIAARQSIASVDEVFAQYVCPHL